MSQEFTPADRLEAALERIAQHVQVSAHDSAHDQDHAPAHDPALPEIVARLDQLIADLRTALDE